MESVLLDLGIVQIRWYGVMMVLGFFSGLASWTILGRKEGKDFNFCSDLLFWVVISGIIGGRIAFVIANYHEFLEDPFLIIRVDKGGLIYYGGFIGALAAVYVFALKRGESVLSMFDFAVTSVPLGHFFGRIGCYIHGCCFGILYDGPFAVTYPAGSNAWFVHISRGTIDKTAEFAPPLLPVQLIEAGINLLIYILLVFTYRRRKSNGLIAGLYMMSYSTVRFFIEFLRGDPRMGMGGFSFAQMISVVIFLAGAVIIFAARRAREKAA